MSVAQFQTERLRSVSECPADNILSTKSCPDSLLNFLSKILLNYSFLDVILHSVYSHLKPPLQILTQILSWVNNTLRDALKHHPIQFPFQ
jgi:hypothetical protein